MQALILVTCNPHAENDSVAWEYNSNAKIKCRSVPYLRPKWIKPSYALFDSEIVLSNFIANPDPEKSADSGPYYRPPSEAVAMVHNRAEPSAEDTKH